VQRDSTLYTILFSIVMCVACSILVAVSAVGLASRQAANKAAYRQKNVLLAAGLIKDGQPISNTEVAKMFDEKVQVKLVNLETGDYDESTDAKEYDQIKASSDPTQSVPAPENSSRISRLPKLAQVFLVMEGDQVSKVVIPVEGYGLWGTLYGFLALEKDTKTIQGITYYDQIETPGLGGEVANPKWKALWHGRLAYNDSWVPEIKVIKGVAGSPEQDPHHIDGLSGATITSNGVSYMMDFWLGEHGFGPYLKKFRETGASGEKRSS